MRVRNTNLLSDLLKTGLDVITLISEENGWQFFLHIVFPCLANHKNGKFTDILKRILWDFDKKNGYFLSLLSIYSRPKDTWSLVIFMNQFYACLWWGSVKVFLFMAYGPIYVFVYDICGESSEFVSSSIPSWQTLTAHAQPFRGARDLAFCLMVPLDWQLVWASSGGSGETARMRRLAWTFAARTGDKYQIHLTRPIYTYIMFGLYHMRAPFSAFKVFKSQIHWNIWRKILFVYGI